MIGKPGDGFNRPEAPRMVLASAPTLWLGASRYTQGLEHEKSNVALHANAAMASIRMGCNVQAIEHADKVGRHPGPGARTCSSPRAGLTPVCLWQAIRICDFLLEKPKHPLKVGRGSGDARGGTLGPPSQVPVPAAEAAVGGPQVKALQRASVARLALHHYKEAISALEEAAKVSMRAAAISACLGARCVLSLLPQQSTPKGEERRLRRGETHYSFQSCVSLRCRCIPGG